MNDAKLCISDPPFDKMKTTTKTYHDTATVQSKNHYVLCKTTQLVGGRRRRRRQQRRLVGQMYVQNAHLLQRKEKSPTSRQNFNFSLKQTYIFPTNNEIKTLDVKSEVKRTRIRKSPSVKEGFFFKQQLEAKKKNMISNFEKKNRILRFW